ncbi:MAG: hypothetical protein WCK49_03850 [Myxococcaceae bacterium]
MDARISAKLRSYKYLDYSVLASLFSEYPRPINPISHLVKQGDLVRLKKGLYVLPSHLREGLLDTEVLANVIYGPSYISLQYALSYYNLIPERVNLVTSMTTQRDKWFSTPVGDFSYKYILPRKYSIGLTLNNTHFLIATPEKALADIVGQEKGFKNSKEVYEYLTENLRIEPEDLARLNLGRVREIARAYRMSSVTFLSQCLEEMK